MQTLPKANLSWFAKTGGDTCFGNLDEVSCSKAGKLFADHIQSVADDNQDSKLKDSTATETQKHP